MSSRVAKRVFVINVAQNGGGAKLYNIYKIEYFIIKNFVKSQYIPI
mgnify:CR=1 FL=1